jgi:PAS domain S-box-containing protein
MTASVALRGSYDYRLVTLSVNIAVLAAYAALDLAGQVATARGRARLLWLSGGAVAMGIGIWAMHYIGMEAFSLPVRVLYDWPTVLISLLAAILASAVALLTVSRSTMGRARMIVGGIFMGSGIAAMHYIGMEAMRLPAMCSYSPWLVALSVVVSIAISCLALHLTFALREHLATASLRRMISGFLLGLAIPAMHYVGMAAVRFMPMPAMSGSLTHSIDVSRFAVVSVALVTLLILGIVFPTSIIDRRFSHQAQRLATSQLQLQAIFDNMTEGILVLDREGKTVLVNQAAQRLLCLPEDPDYAKVMEDFEGFSLDGEPLPPSQWPTVRALRGEFVRNYEMLYRRKSTGETGAREISSAPVTITRGESGQVIMTYRDVTERRHMDEARNRLAAIVESSEDAIIGKSDRGIVTSWNKGAEKLFGYTSAEMVGRSIKQLLPPGHEEEEDDILRRIAQGETVEHFETVRTKKSGEIVNVSLTISPIRDARGRITGASKIARNITEKKQMERQLQQSQKMEAIGQLTGGIAHDFNNLLAVMVGNLDLLERCVAGNEAALKCVHTAQKAAGRGADLTRRLLAFCSNVTLKPAPADMHRSVKNMIELARALGPDIKITSHFEDNMPLVRVDAAGLENALLNLAVNARDAMPKGGTLTITIQRCALDASYPPVHTGELKAGDYARLSISDTGTGMSKETLAHAFEPFFTTKPRGKGTGLGLAMVYGFAKQSGGAARIYSEPGHGTTVSLYLPLADAQPLPPSPSPVFPNQRLTGKALVVDDELDVLEIAATWLDEMGYTTLCADSGPKALRIAEQHPDIVLIVTDIIMPGGMNGVDFAEEVRRQLPRVKLIYCSGFPADALTESSLPHVDSPLLQKPYRRTEFGALVNAVMGGQ